MRYVYLAISTIEYEGFSVIKGFDDQQEAEAFCKKAADYESSKAACPKIDDSDDAWSKYVDRQDAWCEQHPAGRS